jgi:hypothetical protein
LLSSRYGSVCFTANAQSGHAELTGEVRDQVGAPVAQAAVTVTELATNRVFSVTTSEVGIYTITNLRPGLYAVTIDAHGFKEYFREQIKLTTGERVRVDATLETGVISESITIKDDAPLLRTESASLGQVVDSRKIVDIPLNGRNFLSLVSLSAGVAQPPPTSAGPSFPRINGGRPRTNEYLFDGISVLQPEPGLVAFFPIPEAIQEFKVEVNSPRAEFGRSMVEWSISRLGLVQIRFTDQRSNSCVTRPSMRGTSLRQRPQRIQTSQSFDAISLVLS